MRGEGAWRGGACVTGETATAADGKHPTPMHSCLHLCLSLLTNAVINFPKNTKLISFLIV